MNNALKVYSQMNYLRKSLQMLKEGPDECFFIVDRPIFCLAVRKHIYQTTVFRAVKLLPHTQTSRLKPISQCPSQKKYTVLENERLFVSGEFFLSHIKLNQYPPDLSVKPSLS